MRTYARITVQGASLTLLAHIPQLEGVNFATNVDEEAT